MRFDSLRAGLFAALALSTLALAQAENDHRLHLRYGVFDPRLGAPPIPATLLAGFDTNLFIVQFPGPFTDRDRDTIRQLGGTLHSPLPRHAIVVKMNAAAAARAASLATVRWVGPYQPAYRLEPELLTEIAAGAGALQAMPLRKYNMVMADKRADKDALQHKIQAIGGRVTDRQDGSLLFTAELTGAQLLQTARFDEVLWIDRWTPQSTDMNNARIVQGSNLIEQIGGYTGQGVRGHVYEGVEWNHPDWTTPMTNVRSSGIAVDHGHCTAGCIFGNGTSSVNARGHAPDAVGFYTEYNSVTTGFSRNQVIGEVVNLHNCMFTTASWGDAQTPQYTSVSADADDIVFDHRIPWTQSMSNLGNQNARPQAWAKNVISIGGVLHQNNSNPLDDTWGGTGSIGPASDGRLKPELANFYEDVWTSDRSGNAGYSPGNSTTSFGGTSAATPITAGTNALAIQMFTDFVFGTTPRVANGTRFQNRPYAQTVKAMQVACATLYGLGQGSRHQVGWGYPNLATMFLRRSVITIVPEDAVITQSATHTYTVFVPSGQPDLKVCMSFLDPSANPTSTLHAVNDLSVRVIEPGGTISYWGNQGLTQNNTSSTGGSGDTINTVECVVINQPASGMWTIEVSAPTIAQDAHTATAATDATYALVILGGMRLSGSGCARYVPDDNTTATHSDAPFGAPMPTTVTSTLAGPTPHSAGSTMFFDLLGLADVQWTGFAVNATAALGSNLSVHVFTRPGTYVGSTSSQAGWTPVTAGHGIATGVNTGSAIAFDQPLHIGALQPIGVAIVVSDFGVRSTPGTGSYGDQNLAYVPGAVTAGTFSGTLTAPQVPNLSFDYQLTTSGTGNQVYQTILRPQNLGAAGTITGLAFSPGSSGVHYNDTLEVRMSMVPPNHVLSSTFATNLPTPVTVFRADKHSWHTEADAWQDIGLQRSFAYDGIRDVVVEIRATGNHHSSPAGWNSGTNEVPRVYAAGWAAGSPPTMGTVDNQGLRMRVSFDCANAAEFGTSCGPLRASHHNTPVHGTTFWFDLDDAVQNSGVLLAAGFQNSVPYPQNLTTYGFPNCYLWHDLGTTLFKVADTAGSATHGFPLPNTTSFDGVIIYAQWFNLDPAQIGGLTASNYTRLVIGSNDP